ncbi:MAG TPA: hypothetical protein VHW09_01960, partial [Bryobacteraceae bacterium]|nr:hypothetical protein [Bryobacteraceae bacterium]
MTSATNPENGTVTYTYDSSHHVTTCIDQLGSNTIYSYDSYGRLNEAQYYPWNYSGAEDTAQRVTYYYDGVYPCTGVSAAYTTGRLSGVAFGGGVTDDYHNSYCYLYNYTQSGHVATQEMAVTGGFGHYNGITFTANYQWDTEGRMTSQQYPTVHAVGSFGNLSVPMPIAAMQYDANGRLNGMTMDDQDGHGPQPFASATYTPAGQVDHLSWAGYTEVRTYNNL